MKICAGNQELNISVINSNVTTKKTGFFTLNHFNVIINLIKGKVFVSGDSYQVLEADDNKQSTQQSTNR